MRNRKDDFGPKGLYVEVRNNDMGRALAKFKKKVANDGILHEYKERQHYEKPSTKRAKAKAAGRSRWLKTLAKRNSEI
jgi:small subunit ribosomal protein S21